MGLRFTDPVSKNFRLQVLTEKNEDPGVEFHPWPLSRQNPRLTVHPIGRPYSSPCSLATMAD